MAAKKKAATESETAETTEATAETTESPTNESSSKKPAAAKKSAAAKAPAAKAKPKPAPNVNERMEGLQGWMAEIERKQDRMLKIGGGAAILAVLLAGGALALGIINQQNASSEEDVDDLTGQVNELGASIKSDTEDQLKTINGRIDAIEQQVKTIQQTQATQTQDIATLKQQQQQAAASAAAGAAGGTADGLDIQPGVTPPAVQGQGANP